MTTGQRIFISHSSDENALANAIANWFDDYFSSPGLCFCTSKPNSLTPGDDVWESIHEAAESCDISLFLISPDSLNNKWIYYEAGLMYANKSRLVPMLYGGMKPEKLPDMLKRHQACFLELSKNDGKENGSFNSLIVEIANKFGHKGRNLDDCYSDFRNVLIASNDENSKRLLDFGKSSQYVPDAKIGDAHSEKGFVFENGKYILIPRTRQKGVRSDVAAIRIKFNVESKELNQWKFGICLVKQSRFIRQIGYRKDKIYLPQIEECKKFLIHACSENGYPTWSFYPFEIPSGDRPINIPDQLKPGDEIALSLWFRNEGNEVAITTKNSDGDFRRIPGKLDNEFWNIPIVDWDNAVICAWHDIPKQVKRSMKKSKYDLRIIASWDVDRILNPGIRLFQQILAWLPCLSNFARNRARIADSQAGTPAPHS